MRAKISFETDVDRVQEIIGALATEEMEVLRTQMAKLETPSPQNLYEHLAHVLESLENTTTQLLQYQHMLVSFERARFETKVPQNVSDPNVVNTPAQAAAVHDNMKKFDEFLDKINEHSTPDSTAEEV